MAASSIFFFLGHRRGNYAYLNTCICRVWNEKTEAKGPSRSFQHTAQQGRHIFHGPRVADGDVCGLLLGNSAEFQQLPIVIGKVGRGTATHPQLVLSDCYLQLRMSQPEMRAPSSRSSLLFQRLPAIFI